MPTDPELLDLGQLRRLQALEEPEIRAIIDEFASELESRIQRLEAAVAEPDLFRKLLHETRGAASNCGFAALETLCRRFEAFPDSFDADSLRHLAARSREAWRELAGS